MSIGEKVVVGCFGMLFFGLVTLGISAAVNDLREGKRRMAFMSQCIEKWAATQCEIWDRYGRRDLAFRKDAR